LALPWKGGVLGRLAEVAGFVDRAPWRSISGVNEIYRAAAARAGIGGGF